MAEMKSKPLHNRSHLQTALPLIIATLVSVLCMPLTMLAASSGGHADAIAPVLIALVAILAAAKLGAEAAERLQLPAVLGELAAGILLGNLALLNAHWGYFEVLRATPIGTEWAMVLDSLGRLGVVILLFEVGLKAFADLPMPGVAAGISAAAILGKLICGLGLVEKGLDRLSVSIGMIPRGEVGLIFAGVGRSIRIIDDPPFLQL